MYLLTTLTRADPLVAFTSITWTIMSVDNGLLRINTGCAGPLSSSTP